jgi:uracil phosphoribosyltransferase
MLATGGSAAQAIEVVKAAGAKEVVFLCIVASPEGVAAMEQAHPAVAIHAGALDRALNAKKYILPGLGDFGDRLYGT